MVVEASVIHFAGTALTLDQLTFARGIGLAILVAVLARREGMTVFRTESVSLQLARSGLSVISLWAIFYSLTHLPLADASALNYLRPVFATILGAWLLREVIGRRRWSATLLGLCGALVVLGSSFGVWQTAYAAAVAGAAMNAGVLVASRRLSMTDRPETVLAWLAVVLLLFSARAVTLPVPPDAWPVLFAIAVCSAVGLWLGQVAVKFADVSLLAPYDYVRLPILMLVGLVVFLQVPSPTTLLGSALILLSAGLLFLRESHTTRR